MGGCASVQEEDSSASYASGSRKRRSQAVVSVRSPTAEARLLFPGNENVAGDDGNMNGGQMHFAAFDVNESADEDNLALQAGHPTSAMNAGGAPHHHYHHQGQLVSFPNLDAAFLEEASQLNHVQRAAMAQSPASILLKTSSVSNGNTVNSFNNDTSVSSGPAEWRERRRARALGEDLGSSGRTSSHCSTGSRSTPITRFLGVDDNVHTHRKVDEVEEREEGFARVQALVVRMNQSTSTDGDSMQRPKLPTRSYTNSYRAAKNGKA